MRRAVLVFGLILSIAFQGMALAGQIRGWDRGAARGAANAPPEGHDSAFLEGLRRPPR